MSILSPTGGTGGKYSLRISMNSHGNLRRTVIVNCCINMSHLMKGMPQLMHPTCIIQCSHANTLTYTLQIRKHMQWAEAVVTQYGVVESCPPLSMKNIPLGNSINSLHVYPTVRTHAHTHTNVHVHVCTCIYTSTYFPMDSGTSVR